MSRTKNFLTLKEAKENIKNLKSYKRIITPEWSLYKMLRHCSQTIEYSMIGYPKEKSKFFQLTIGKIIIKNFLKQGYMTHDLQAPVLGSPELPDDGDLDEAINEICEVIERFEKFSETLAPHLIFGKLSHKDYDSYFTMHINEHFSELSFFK